MIAGDEMRDRRSPLDIFCVSVTDWLNCLTTRRPPVAGAPNKAIAATEFVGCFHWVRDLLFIGPARLFILIISAGVLIRFKCLWPLHFFLFWFRHPPRRPLERPSPFRWPEQSIALKICWDSCTHKEHVRPSGVNWAQFDLSGPKMHYGRSPLLLMIMIVGSKKNKRLPIRPLFNFTTVLFALH